jgi:hypothetical protein
MLHFYVGYYEPTHYPKANESECDQAYVAKPISLMNRTNLEDSLVNFRAPDQLVILLCKRLTLSLLLFLILQLIVGDLIDFGTLNQTLGAFFIIIPQLAAFR